MHRERLTCFLIYLAVMGALQGCSKDWPAFRHNVLRTANQLHNSRLADPAKVATLAVVWNFQPPSASGFRASPIVYKKRVYIGNGNGFFYALKANDGSLVWQYPASGGTPLDTQFHCNPSSRGIASSAVIAEIGGTDAVIFGAPDRSSGSHLGDGHLFALNATTGASYGNLRRWRWSQGPPLRVQQNCTNRLVIPLRWFSTVTFMWELPITATIRFKTVRWLPCVSRTALLTAASTMFRPIREAVACGVPLPAGMTST